MPIGASRADVQRLMAGGAQVIEVLDGEEYAWAHLPGASNVPLKQLEDRLVEVDAGRPVVVYCNDTL